MVTIAFVIAFVAMCGAMFFVRGDTAFARIGTTICTVIALGIVWLIFKHGFFR